MSLKHYNLDLIEALDELSEMPGYDASYSLAYHNSWSDYENSGWLAIFKRNGEFFKCDGGYSPEVGDIEERLVYEPVSLEQAREEINSFEEVCTNSGCKLSL
jgi:hypothetical protein